LSYKQPHESLKQFITITDVASDPRRYLVGEEGIRLNYS
jgi:hypothetical protein